jgi:single-stranded-DNA-specific exonuclease
MSRWLEPPEVAVPEDLYTFVGGHPLVAQVLVQRGLRSVAAARAFLNPDCYTPCSPFELPGMEPAVIRLEQAISKQGHICVWGDFDVDGQTATTLLVSVLRELGANVTYYIPRRAYESHGINIAGLEQLIAQGVNLLLTCDTGISSHAALDYAQEHGLDVIVTDHHSLPDKLPDAYTIINPQTLPENHPLYSLPGVGVAYKLAEGLHQGSMRRACGELVQYLDLVALGIVADVALQTGETRYLLQRGLQALRNTQRLGLQVMMELAELSPIYLSEDHIGYVLAPRLNALGRLEDANPVVDFLTTSDEGHARILAYQLESLNAQRKLLTDQVFQGALAQIEKDPTLLDYTAVVLSHPSWPAGVLGIVASRLVSRFKKPVVLIATDSTQAETGSGRGSARSIPAINITTALNQNQDLLESFGGHPMAAGLSIQAARIPEFRRHLSRTIQEIAGEGVLEAIMQIDGYLSLSELTLALVEDLERLAPFGPGNPALTIASRGLKLQSHSLIGRNGEHLQLIVEDEAGTTQKVVWWQGAGWSLPEGSFDLAYTVRASTYRGLRDVQVTWLEARQLETQTLELSTQPLLFKVVDYRHHDNPHQQLEGLQAEQGLQIWSEADALHIPGSHDRYNLQPCRLLAIWTTPPGRAELQAALTSASPKIVYLFGIDPPTSRLETFLKHLVGLVKYTINSKAGCTTLPALAAATAQRPVVVQLGLAWFQACGDLVVTSLGGSMQANGELWLQPGDPGKAHAYEAAQILTRLKAILDETSAYRAYFARAEAETLLMP